MTPRAERTWIVLLLVLLAFLYLPALQGEVLDWDDDVWFGDPALADPLLAFTTGRDRIYAPVLRLSWFVQHAVFGARTWGYHLVDLGLFLGLVYGTWRLVRELGVPAVPALVATWLWALHPTKVEAVAWMTSLKDLQSGALLVVAGLVAVRRGAPVVVAALVALATFTKAATFPLPFVLLVALVPRFGWREAARRMGPACAVALVPALIGALVWEARYLDAPLALRLQLAGWVHGTFWLKLSPGYFPAAITPLTTDPRGAIVLGAILTGAFALLAWRDARLRVPLALWVLPLVPFTGTVDMAFWAGDRHLLFPSLGVALAVALLLPERPGPWPALAGVLLAVPTALRVPEWRSSLALWEADARRPGDDPNRAFKLGTVYGKVGRFAEAEAAFDASLRLRPGHGPTVARRIVASLAKDDWTKEDAALVRLLEPPPADAAAWARAEAALRAAGRPDLAALIPR